MCDIAHGQALAAFVQKQEDQGCTCVLVATPTLVLGAVAIMVRVSAVDMPGTDVVIHFFSGFCVEIAHCVNMAHCVEIADNHVHGTLHC